MRFCLASHERGSSLTTMHQRFVIGSLLAVLTTTLGLPGRAAPSSDKPSTLVRKVEDLVIYQDARFYSAFPSIVRRPNGELVVAFQAPL